MSLNRIVAVIAAALLFVQPVFATVIIQAETVSTTFLPGRNLAAEDVVAVINQVGLSGPVYSSGDTVYGEVLSQTHEQIFPVSTPANGFVGTGNPGDQGQYDFGLGDTYMLTNFVLWSGEPGFGIHSFELRISTIDDFSSATPVLMGDEAMAADVAAVAQDFSFDPILGAYAWLTVIEG